MKFTQASPIGTALRQDVAVYAKPRLIAEWNLNRYHETVADNIPSEDSEGYDIDMFPIESIALPNRPTKGIIKARVGEAKVADNYEGKQSSRYYVGDVDDDYKYWCSPYPTNGSNNFPTHTDAVTVVRPYVDFTPCTPCGGEGIEANKIVIGFENTWSSPVLFNVLVRDIPEGAWYSIATNPVINSDGQVILYHQGSGVWGGTVIRTELKDIAGIMVSVSSMDKPDAFCNVIEISLRREEDLTSKLITVDDTFDMAEISMFLPIGTTTSNTGSISLSNVDGVFNKENITSTYHDIIEPNVHFNLEYVYTIGGIEYPVQQFSMFGDAFLGQITDTVEIGLTDFSKYFQEATPRPAFYQDITVPEIIWRICDSVGFTDYEINLDDLAPENKIPYFWTDGLKTVWEIFDELAQGTQTAVYFDGYGKLQVRTRTAAFKSARTPDWTLRGKTSGTNLADIVSISQTDELESNHVTVTYQTTGLSDWNRGAPALQSVWEPEGTVVLRACALVKTLGTSDTFLWITSKDSVIWPYSGMAQIQGELIRYDGKQYVYYDAAVRTTKVILTNEEKIKCDAKSNAAKVHLNHFTGGLFIKERGVWNSEEKRHPVEAEGYDVRHIEGGTRRTDVEGFHFNKSESTVTLATTPRFKSENDLLVVTRGDSIDSGFYYLGTKLKFRLDGRTTQKAGMVFNNNGNNEDGYYIELTTSAQLSQPGGRAARNELIFFTRKNGVNTRIGPNNGHGVAVACAAEIFYELDLIFKVAGNEHEVAIYMNGKLMFTAVVPTAKRNDFGGQFGLHARGDTKASYEYLYAIARTTENPPPDDSSFFDKVDGGYRGGQWDREWVYRWRSTSRRVRRNSGKERKRWNLQFFDEFGPIVHEVREYDIKFDPAPVLHSRLYLSNDWSVVCPEYKSNSFGAKFYLSNASRDNAVINGEDTLSYAGSKGSVTQIMRAYGRVMVISEAADVIAKNDAQIRARGKIESEVSSPWIQSEAQAKAIAKWIEAHWSIGADIQNVTVFGNPLFEIGDVVDIDYPEFHMGIATHKYFVVGTATSFDQGIETNLTLRRIV